MRNFVIIIVSVFILFYGFYTTTYIPAGNNVIEDYNNTFNDDCFNNNAVTNGRTLVSTVASGAKNGFIGVISSYFAISIKTFDSFIRTSINGLNNDGTVNNHFGTVTLYTMPVFYDEYFKHEHNRSPNFFDWILFSGYLLKINSINAAGASGAYDNVSIYDSFASYAWHRVNGGESIS